MLNFQIAELQQYLVMLCPDHAGIEVEHLGHFRVKVHAVASDGHKSLIVLYLNDEHTPPHWARKIAQQLHTTQVFA